MNEISDQELDELDRYLGNMPISCKNSKRLIATIRTLKAQLAEPPLDSDLAQTVERQAEEIAWLKDRLQADRTPPALTEEQRLQMLCVLANGIRSCEFSNLAWEQAKTGFDTLRAAGYTISYTVRP